MVSLAKLLRIRQGIEKKYKNMGLEKFLLSIAETFLNFPILDLHLDWIFDLDEIKETGN